MSSSSVLRRTAHGAAKPRWVDAGDGIVDWTAVFGELRRIGYDGFLSIHCEYDIEEGADWFETFVREVAFFPQDEGQGQGVREEK